MDEEDNERRCTCNLVFCYLCQLDRIDLERRSGGMRTLELSMPEESDDEED